MNRKAPLPAPSVLSWQLPAEGSPNYEGLDTGVYLTGPPPPLSLEEQAARDKAHKAAEKKARAEALKLERAAFVSAPNWEGDLPKTLFGKYGTAGLKKKDRAAIHKKIKAASDKAVAKPLKGR